jgi:hypothetical protein
MVGLPPGVTSRNNFLPIPPDIKLPRCVVNLMKEKSKSEWGYREWVVTTKRGAELRIVENLPSSESSGI